MPYSNLSDAAKHCASLRDLIVLRPGGWSDDETLRRVQDVARAAMACATDAEWTASLQAVVSLAADLYSDGDHQRWAQGQTSGRDVLRLRILREIRSAEDRIVVLQHRDGSEGLQPDARNS